MKRFLILYLSFIEFSLLSYTIFLEKESLVDIWVVSKYQKGQGAFSLIRKSVRDFFRTRGFLRILDGFFVENKRIFAKDVRECEICWE